MQWYCSYAKFFIRSNILVLNLLGVEASRYENIFWKLGTETIEEMMKPQDIIIEYGSTEVYRFEQQICQVQAQSLNNLQGISTCH